MNNLSVTDSVDGRESGLSIEKVYKNVIWSGGLIVVNIVFYLFTFYKSDSIIDDGEGMAYCIEFAWLTGFLLTYQIAKILSKFNRNIVDIEEEPNLEQGFLGSYKYNAFQESKWFILGISGTVGALNVIIYLAVLIYLTK